MTEPRNISFGFLVGPFQALDVVGPVDVLHNACTKYVQAISNMMPNNDSLIQASLDIEFHHVGADMNPVSSTGGLFFNPTCTYENCPKLDYLLVGGPDPKFTIDGMPDAMKEFIRAKAEECRTVFTTCTGAFVVAAAGVLDGQDATVNHAIVDFGKQHFPNVRWVNDRNWVVSNCGRFWTASGAVSGTDMMNEWVRQQCGDGLVGLGTMLLEYQPRDVVGKPLSYVNGRGEMVEVKS